jgi:NDP-sugar pyrophosphorylase family protein
MHQAPEPKSCQTRHAIILAAGESTRTRPLTLHRPKPLIPLLGQPLLAHILDELVGLIEEVTLVVGYRADDIQTHFGPNYRSMRIRYVHQHEVNGTAGALLTVADHAQSSGETYLDAPFFLLYGDNLISRSDLVGVCQHRYSLAGLRVEDPRAFGVLDIVDNRVRRIIEKPDSPPPEALANPGIYHFDGQVIPALRSIAPSPRGEYELTDLIEAIAADHPVSYSLCKGQWVPVGNPWEVLIASAFLLQQRAAHRSEIHPDAVYPDCQMSGSVAIGRATIGAGCTIKGPAFIGDHVTIGTGCTLERVAIESGATIGDHTTIERSLIGPGARVGANCAIAYSVLDDNARVGPGTRLLAHRFTEIEPAAFTAGLLTKDVMQRRGTVVGPGVALPGRSTLGAGSVLFPEE